ncbi:hypothetical protein INR49_032261 [Caranx melampygus]|nr:hypothetical protein INR49_032261 [Caranx melampygus]
MSSDRVPSRAEVLGWSPPQLADYLKRMNLSGCDKAVIKNNISGSRFVNLSDNDLQKFPKLHAPLISKLSTEISRKEEKKSLFGKRTTPKYHEPDPSTTECWDDDEFSDDDDYESPNSGEEDGSGGDYESPNDDQDGTNDYEPPPTEPPDDLAHKLCPTLPIGDGDYIDNRDNHVSSRAPPPVVCPRPSVPSLSAPRVPGDPTRRDPSPRPPGKFPPAPPQIFRDSKPGRDSGSNPSPIRGPHRNTVDREPSTWSKPPVPSLSSSVSRSNSSARPPPNRFDGRREVCPLALDSLAPPHATETVFPPVSPKCTLEMDPRWYVGKVTRGQAEGCLKRVYKDGAYLVRDSTRQLANQPFTLMVFYQDKVYNIQIRQQHQEFLLGTGLKLQEVNRPETWTQTWSQFLQVHSNSI